MMTLCEPAIKTRAIKTRVQVLLFVQRIHLVPAPPSCGASACSSANGSPPRPSAPLASRQRRTAVAARTTAVLHRHAGWTFLESVRFDRAGRDGRRGLVSLAALDAAWFGEADTSWVDAAERLRREGWLPPGGGRPASCPCAGGLDASSATRTCISATWLCSCRGTGRSRWLRSMTCCRWSTVRGWKDASAASRCRRCCRRPSLWSFSPRRSAKRGAHSWA